ncbi:hypothetical protein [Thalassotalea crassostreae]|uniref:hypothetical protein n=1 Tax=Thalassotalea crassostreae TaxID=1763536 RepID=UPI000839A3F2|nr:hypothetical protein [Thalassotalea crassostreae]
MKFKIEIILGALIIGAAIIYSPIAIYKYKYDDCMDHERQKLGLEKDKVHPILISLQYTCFHKLNVDSK